MIKFFRKIRQRLLRENRLSSYLLYTIGEIVLVVVGILIALQINTWNEKRKAQAESLQLLSNLRTDFVQAIEELRAKNGERLGNISAIDELQSRLAQTADGQERTVDSLLGVTLITPTYNGKSESLAILFNTGKINLIENERLKELLFLWPQELDGLTEGEQHSAHYKEEVYFPLIQKHVSWNRVVSTLQFKNLDFEYKPSRFPRDYDALLGDKDLENSLSYLGSDIAILIYETNKLVEMAEEILDIIDTETEPQR